MAADEIVFRQATLEDAEIILHHRRSMFRDMGQGDEKALDAMVELARPWIRTALVDGSYRAWLAQDGRGRIVAGAGVLLTPWPASPRDLTQHRATILNVYTEPEYRKRGLARRLMLLILEHLKKDEFTWVQLHASDAGRPLYEKLGFEPTNEMRVKLK